MHRPYPFDALPKLTRGQVHALASWHALFSDAAHDEAIRIAERLVGTSLTCTAGLPHAAQAGAARAMWAELESSQAADLPSAWLELPLGLAALAADRVLGNDTETLDVPASALDAVATGALAYLLARVLAALAVPLVLRDVIGAPPALADAVCLPLSVSCWQAQSTLRLYVPSRWLARAHAQRRALRSLPAVRIALWADAGYARLDAATLRSLQRDDCLVLEHTSLVRAADGTLEGTLQVRVEGSTSALACLVRPDGLEVEAITCTSEPSMKQGELLPDPEPPRSAGDRWSSEGSRRSDASLPDANAALARDAPIELSLEIARFALSLGELERLRAGDVLLTGRRIGELVTLRAAGRAFAEGELVDVEGELGVRLTRFLGA